MLHTTNKTSSGETPALRKANGSGSDNVPRVVAVRIARIHSGEFELLVEAPDEHTLAQNMALHGGQNIIAAGVGTQGEFRIESK